MKIKIGDEVTTPKYALSGYAEWFWLMAMNWKDVENRNWPLPKKIKLPTRIYLHASKNEASKEEIVFIKSKLTYKQNMVFNAIGWSHFRGYIIGETTIIGQCRKGEFNLGEILSPWFFGKYGFIVKDGILYDKPIPCRGQLGFFVPDIKEIRRDNNNEP